jgi:2-dehydropantoate 2-reductase
VAPTFSGVAREYCENFDMALPDRWPRLAVVGAGAVGGYFGGLMARAGAPVVMIGRKSFVDAVKTQGIFLDTLGFKEFVHLEASAEFDAARGADIVFLCVKTTDNAAAARGLAPFLAPTSIVLSLQNGVDNVEQLRAAANIAAFQAVVYVAVSVPRLGHVKHVGRGDLVIGPETEQTQKLAALCARADVPCRISDNIEGELWTKLTWNCALNAISALGQAKYGRMVENANARELIETVIQEVLAVARAARIALPGIENTEMAMTGAMKIATQMAEAQSSTAQDLSRGKPTEIDSLNGFIARRGLELGVPTPMNSALTTLVKLAENR